MPNTSTSTASCVLPEDIWGAIAEQLGAFDVFSLSQACRELYSFLSGRDLWIRVLRSVCRRHGVFLPTYPVSEMEMTLAQIQRAASRPERWHNLIRKRASPLGPWDSHASMSQHPEGITPTLAGEFWPPRPWAEHLVPGGRFLVAFSLPNYYAPATRTENAEEPATVVLSVWDLGVPGSADHRVPSVLASETINIAFPTRDFADLSRSGVAVVDDSVLRIVIVHPNGDWRHLSWMVLAFDFEFSAHHGIAPLLKRRRESITINWPTVFILEIYLHGDRVLLRFPKSIVIWDLGTTKYVGLKVRDFSIEHMLWVLTSHHLVCIGVQSLGVWHLSALDWMDGGPLPRVDYASFPFVPPDIVVSDPWNHKGWYGIVVSQVPIPGVTENQVYVDVNYEIKGKPSAARYRLDVTPHTPRSLLGLPMADEGARLTLTLIFATHFPNEHFQTSGDLAHGQICRISGSGASRRGPKSYAYVPNYRPSVTLMTPSKLEEESALTQYVCLGVHSPQAFCALSGRMIYLDWSTFVQEHWQKAKVFDYLP